MQQYTVYLYLSTAVHVSGGISTHHQELITVYLPYLPLMRPLLRPVVNVTGLEPGPDHPKHVEKLIDINKLYIIASCWIIIAIHWYRVLLIFFYFSTYFFASFSNPCFLI